MRFRLAAAGLRSAMPTTSRRFDADTLAASQTDARLAADLDLAAVAVDDRSASGSAVGATIEAVGASLAAVGEQRYLSVGEQLDLAHDAIAPAMQPGAARAAAE